MKLSIIIPVYNEEKTILEILKRIEAVDLSYLNCEKEIIVVDDKSTDDTRELLESRIKNQGNFSGEESGEGSGVKAWVSRGKRRDYCYSRCGFGI